MNIFLIILAVFLVTAFAVMTTICACPGRGGNAEGFAEISLLPAKWGPPANRSQSDQLPSTQRVAVFAQIAALKSVTTWRQRVLKLVRRLLTGLILGQKGGIFELRAKTYTYFYVVFPSSLRSLCRGASMMPV